MMLIHTYHTQFAMQVNMFVQCLNSAIMFVHPRFRCLIFRGFLLFVSQASYLFFASLSDLGSAELCNVFRYACFSSIPRLGPSRCASSRGRRSKCRGRSSSVAVVILKPTNHQRSPCSCYGCGTSGNSRTTRHLHRTQSGGDLYLAPDGKFPDV